MKKRDLTNMRFGRLTAIKSIGKNKWGNCMWLCICDCGKEHIVPSGKLINERSSSCGCLKKELCTKRLEKHGLTTNGEPRTFIIWKGMKARCYNPNSISFKSYGKRGIKVCKEWLSFEKFHTWAMLNGYKDNLTLDRINPDDDYKPDNCRWISSDENKMRQRKSILLTIEDTTLSITRWGKKLGISRFVISKYYKFAGKEKTEKALSECLLSGKGQVYFVNKFLNPFSI